MVVLDMLPVTGGREDIRRALVACIEAIELKGISNVGISVQFQAVADLREVFDEHELATQSHPDSGSLRTVEGWKKVPSMRG